MEAFLFIAGFAVGWLFATLAVVRPINLLANRASQTFWSSPVSRLELLEYAEPDNPEEEDELARQRREAERGFFA